MIPAKAKCKLYILNSCPKGNINNNHQTQRSRRKKKHFADSCLPACACMHLSLSLFLCFCLSCFKPDMWLQRCSDPPLKATSFQWVKKENPTKPKMQGGTWGGSSLGAPSEEVSPRFVPRPPDPPPGPEDWKRSPCLEPPKAAPWAILAKCRSFAEMDWPRRARRARTGPA